MKKAIIYLRETRGEKLEEQIEACRRYANEQGFEAHTVVVDFLMPGPAYRLGLRGALDMVGAGDMEVLVALDPDQVSKDPTRLRDIEEMLREKSCELHYARGS